MAETWPTTREDDRCELVVLLADGGRPIGAAPKATVHHRDTPLHLAFSCYVFDTSWRFLSTRRAWSKRTWPSTLTNSCCGHPGPGEALEAAVRRRLDFELGLVPPALHVVLPDFRYRAVMADGVVENEVCPMFVAVVDGEPIPNPAEVADARWSTWEEFIVAARVGAASPWCLEQLDALEALGRHPTDWLARS